MIHDDGTNETWQDTLYRVVKNLYSYLTNDQLTLIKQNPSQMFSYMFDMKFLPSGRSLWAMDRKIIEKCQGICLNSCSYFSFNEDHPVDIFCNIMNVLMLGCGSAFDTWINNNDYVIHEPNRKEQQMLLIPDTRSGWVFSVRLLLSSYLYENKNEMIFNYNDIRKKRRETQNVRWC